MVENYTADRGSLNRFYNIDLSAGRRQRMQRFYGDWLQLLEKTNFDKLSQDGRVDYLLFANQLRYELRKLDLEAQSAAEIRTLIPFAQTIIDLAEARQRMEKLDPAKAAATLNDLNKRIRAARETLEKSPPPKRTVANDAAQAAERLRAALTAWFNFYNGYDPLFTWWNDAPFKEVDATLKSFGGYLRERLAGVRNSEEIIGSPIGRQGLLTDLAREWIPYTPEELIELANKEYAWCENEMKKASRELGYGDDWLKALEYVKTLHVEPGKQPEMIKFLADEAVEFLRKHDLVTIPPVALETWRMEMMTPQRQLVNPFFTGGEVISVSFPTESMAHEQKLMSLRGNNIHFARATVFHELIPGHHLQGYMHQRYRSYRNAFSTSFSGEGFALYWEMLLWDMNFPKTPENKIGMLFWRMHRCARIIFSLSFHLGKMTPQECIDFLVNKVGHERDNATAEVRRSFAGNYSPLYQAAYLLGGLQIRSLHKELVQSGKMTNRQFHDRFLTEGRIPIELLRAAMTSQKLTRDQQSAWRFYGIN
ncbi:MAG TPA: DUF885 domain-containing protein [Solibacterales bacterium]|nr:DUF885 domain-containing protein [Bryobacterales bacterium]